jgi:hypothetical protein
MRLETVENLRNHDDSIILAGQPEQLYEFKREVAKKVRGVQFKGRDRSSLWVYRDTDFTALGYIGYGDFQTTRYAADKSYAVFAPTIENAKYANYSEQNRMRQSKNMNTAIRHAKSYLIKAPLLTTTSGYITKVSSKLNVVTANLKNAVSTAKENIGLSSYARSTSLLDELLHLHKRDHGWLNPTMSDKLQAYIEAEHEYQLDAQQVLPAMFIHMYDKFGAQHCDIVDIENIKLFSEYSPERHATVRENVRLDTLSQDIVDRMYTLNMVEAGDYVDEVGVKINNAAYLLHV